MVVDDSIYDLVVDDEGHYLHLGDAGDISSARCQKSSGGAVTLI